MLKLFYSVYLLFTTLFSGEGALILNVTTNHYHWGCTGTSTALKKEIEQLGYHVDSVSIKDLHACKEVPESIDQFSDEHLYQNFIENNPLVFAKLKKNKVIVINGEGSIHNNRHLPRTLLYIAYISKHFLGKHVEIINHSAYPEDKLISTEKTNIDLYHNVYEILDYYSVREPISKEALQNIGLSPNLSFDSLPLYIKKYYQMNVERDPKLIVLSGSVAWEQKGLDIVVSELKSLEKQGYRIEVLIGAKENPAYDDQMLIKHLSNELNHGWTLVNAKSMDEWLSTINKAGLLISGRFHHTIAALCLQTPFVVLNSNTPKIEGMLKLAGLESKRVLYYNDPRLDTLLREEIEHTLNCSNHNFPTITHLCELAEKNFDGLKKISAKKSADIIKFKRYKNCFDSARSKSSKKEPCLTQ